MIFHLSMGMMNADFNIGSQNIQIIRYGEVIYQSTFIMLQVHA